MVYTIGDMFGSDTAVPPYNLNTVLYLHPSVRKSLTCLQLPLLQGSRTVLLGPGCPSLGCYSPKISRA